jgi:hypothetical protein
MLYQEDLIDRTLARLRHIHPDMDPQRCSTSRATGNRPGP